MYLFIYLSALGLSCSMWDLIPWPGIKPGPSALRAWSLSHLEHQGKVKVKVAQLCPTLCNPMDCIVHGVLQARILEWVAFPLSRGSSQPRDQTQVSCLAGGFFTSWATREAVILIDDICLLLLLALFLRPRHCVAGGKSSLSFSITLFGLKCEGNCKK